MRISRLTDIIEDWVRWHKVDNHKLGYPSKVSYMSAGSYSAHAFDDMIDVADNKNVKTIDAIIHSLPLEQRQAIYARYLGDKKPLYYELKLGLAMDSLLTIAGRRIDA